MVFICTGEEVEFTLNTYFNIVVVRTKNHSRLKYTEILINELDP